MAAYDSGCQRRSVSSPYSADRCRKPRKGIDVTSKGTGKAPKGYRKPSYGAAGRHARIVYELLDRPHGWSFEAIQNEL